MVTALVFDCFGVLTTDAWLPFKQQHFGHDKALFAEATDLNKQSDAGFITYNEFVAGVAELAGMKPEAVREAIEDNVANEALFAFIKSVKPQHKLAMLSNASYNWLDELFTPEQLALFDEVSLSYQSGQIKPQPEAYQAVVDKLGVPAEQCVLIDDQERYCTAARDNGWQAIWFQDTEQCIADLQNLLGQNSSSQSG